MKIFMLGWDQRPDHAGGAGAAAYGLAKALVAHGLDIVYLLPRPASGKPPVPHASIQQRKITPSAVDEVQRALIASIEHAATAEAIDPAALPAPTPPPLEIGQPLQPLQPHDTAQPLHTSDLVEITTIVPRVELRPVDVLLSPYLTARQYHQVYLEHIEEMYVPAALAHHHASNQTPTRTQSNTHHHSAPLVERWAERAISAGANGHVSQPANYSAYPEAAPESAYLDNLFDETKRYAQLAMGIARKESFDAVHAHDWMTFEAAMAVAAQHAVPLIVQIHSTELDRAASTASLHGHANANPEIMEVERQAMSAADAVIAVSYLTKTQLIEKYGIDPQKIHVVYSAPPSPTDSAPEEKSPTAKKRADRIVLFLGRLTEQKGPDYFLQAARKVLEVEKRVKFVLAGGGEMAEALMVSAEDLGISPHIVFTGFLKKREVDKVLKLADLYVMPSISEPFGLTSLEALNADVPVIISKQSGVAELLRHVLKVDFWDTQELANKIVAVLRHPSLAQTLREEGKSEVRLLTWEDSARRVADLYDSLQPEQSTPEELPA